MAARRNRTQSPLTQPRRKGSFESPCDPTPILPKNRGRRLCGSDEVITFRRMAAESNAVELGSPCPDFRLPSATGGHVARDDLKDVPVLGVFFY
jgi:hypothetical protein